jgi:hypothetical protein
MTTCHDDVEVEKMYVCESAFIPSAAVPPKRMIPEPPLREEEDEDEEEEREEREEDDDDEKEEESGIVVIAWKALPEGIDIDGRGRLMDCQERVERLKRYMSSRMRRPAEASDVPPKR